MEEFDSRLSNGIFFSEESAFVYWRVIQVNGKNQLYHLLE